MVTTPVSKLIHAENRKQNIPGIKEALLGVGEILAFYNLKQTEDHTPA